MLEKSGFPEVETFRQRHVEIAGVEFHVLQVVETVVKAAVLLGGQRLIELGGDELLVFEVVPFGNLLPHLRQQ